MTDNKFYYLSRDETQDLFRLGKEHLKDNETIDQNQLHRMFIFLTKPQPKLTQPQVEWWFKMLAHYQTVPPWLSDAFLDGRLDD